MYQTRCDELVVEEAFPPMVIGYNAAGAHKTCLLSDHDSETTGMGPQQEMASRENYYGAINDMKTLLQPCYDHDRAPLLA